MADTSVATVIVDGSVRLLDLRNVDKPFLVCTAGPLHLHSHLSRDCFSNCKALSSFQVSHCKVLNLAVQLFFLPPLETGI